MYDWAVLGEWIELAVRWTHVITAIAWILLLGPNAGLVNVALREIFGVTGLFNIFSMGGLILVLTFSFYPIVFFATVAALDNMDPSYEEAAQMSGASGLRSSLSISLPLVLPATVSSSVFVFLEAMGAFGAPAAASWRAASRFMVRMTMNSAKATISPISIRGLPWLCSGGAACSSASFFARNLICA